ncbi:MAG: 5-oxoprolinase subunit PxpB [Granulosicoccus sp.]
MNEGSTDVVGRMSQVAGTGSNWTALYAGDTALILQFGEKIDRSIVDQVTALDTLIHKAIEAGSLVGVAETVPTFRSLAIVYDISILTPDKLLDTLRSLEAAPSNNPEKIRQAPRRWQLPVLYGSSHGPDLDSVSQLTGLSPEKVIDLHATCEFTVYMLGFLPGYAFLGDTPASLHLPRRSEPRLRVPAGSVAIAMQLTGIYPWESPGGWHIIGNCPVPMFNAGQTPPALLKAGDKVSFRQIDQHEFDQLSKELAHADSARSRWSVAEK